MALIAHFGFRSLNIIYDTGDHHTTPARGILAGAELATGAKPPKRRPATGSHARKTASSACGPNGLDVPKIVVEAHVNVGSFWKEVTQGAGEGATKWDSTHLQSRVAA